MSDSGVPPHEMFGLFDTVLDPDTAERLLDGRLPLEDAPPDAHGVTQVINRLAVAPTAAELENESAAVAAIAAAVRRSAPTRPPAGVPVGKYRITRMAAACTMGALTLFGGLAAANALPRPAQRMAANVFGSFGVSIPKGDDAAHGDQTPAPPAASSSAKSSALDRDPLHATTTPTNPTPAKSPNPSAPGGSGADPASGNPTPSNPSNGGTPPGQGQSGDGNGNGASDPLGNSGDTHDHAPGQVKKSPNDR